MIATRALSKRRFGHEYSLFGQSGACFVRWLAVITFLLFAFGATASAQDDDAFETRAETTYLIDYELGGLLYAKNADKRFQPGNMAKLMTLAVVFDALRDDRLALEKTFTITEDAWRRGGAPSGGTTMFAELNSQVSVRDLIKGAIIHYANDACIALALGLAGTEQGFATLMNEHALEIGLRDSNFTNSTGYNDPNSYTTARDMAVLARYVIRNYPVYYQYFDNENFEWNGIFQSNRNSARNDAVGADGLFISFVEGEGYGLVTSAVKDDRRHVLVMTGFSSTETRAAELRRILSWSLRNFDQIIVFDEGISIAAARVFGGEQLYVDVAGEGAIRALLPRGGDVRLSARLIYDGPLRAPVRRGQYVGNVEINRDGQRATLAPVYAVEDVAVGSLTDRALSSLMELTLGRF